jgi:hypothetical protein
MSNKATIESAFAKEGRDYFIKIFNWTDAETDEEIKQEIRDRAAQAGIFEMLDGTLVKLSIGNEAQIDATLANHKKCGERCDCKEFAESYGK